MLISVVLLFNLIYPVRHLRYPGVDPGVLGPRTPDAPRDDAHLGELSPRRPAEQGTAAVTL